MFEIRKAGAESEQPEDYEDYMAESAEEFVALHSIQPVRY